MLVVSVAAVVQALPIHREPRVLGWAGARWVFLVLARWQGPAWGEIGEIFLTCVGALLLVVAHQLNRSLAYWQNREYQFQKTLTPQNPETKP
jgi:hypothetical protein